jgi:hypothetical protein
VGGRLYERFRARATWAENKDVLKDHSLIVAKPYSER